MPDTPEPVVLVASAEFTLKSSPVRRTLEQRLVDDLRLTLTRGGFGGFRVEKDAARLVVCGLKEVKAAAQLCSKVFGVAYAAPAILLPASIEPVLQSIVGLATKELRTGQSFAIRAHRSSPNPLSRREVELKGGSAVLHALANRGVKVDLDDPDLTFHVDLTGEGAYVYYEKFQGPGGLPLSSQWKMLAVLDSGPLTLLAAYAMMRRGCLVELFVPTSNTMPAFAKENQLALARRLRGLVTRPTYRLFTFNLDAVPVAALGKEAGQVFSSRGLIRSVAVKFAKEKKFKGIIFADVGGDVGRVQTALPVAVDLPVFTPLIGFNSGDLRELADFAGVNPAELLSPVEPQTRAKFSVVGLSENLDSIKVEQISL